jgi:hypothetical protein
MRKETLSPIKNNVFSRVLSVTLSSWMSTNPGRKVSNTKTRICLKTGTLKSIDRSAKAINDSANAHVSFEPRGTIGSFMGESNAGFVH